MESPRPSRVITIGRPVLTCVLLVVAYYLVPIDPDAWGSTVAWRAVLTVIVGLVVTWLIAREIRHHLVDPRRAPLIGLLAALVAGVVFFALADYIVAVSDDDQFVGLLTKTDGLYFALTTLVTVGYGDVHAEGQVARGLVSIQMLFNVIVIAGGVTVLSRQLRARARERHGVPPDTD
jgi:hypothetical protein